MAAEVTDLRQLLNFNRLASRPVLRPWEVGCSPLSRASAPAKSPDTNKRAFKRPIFDASSPTEITNAERIVTKHDEEAVINHDEEVGTNHNANVGANHNVNIGANHNANVGENHNANVGENHNVNVGVNHNANVGANHNANVGANRNANVGANHNARVVANHDNDEDEVGLSAAEVSIMRKILRTQLLVSSHEVEVLRKNSNSPLYSVKSFEQLQLPEDLLKGVYAMGFNAPSKIQETTLPTLLADPPVNMIAQSQSGTGKTAAFVLSSLARVNLELHYPQVLILAPTYELALQIGEVAKKMAQFCEGIEFRMAVRGESLPRGSTITEHIVIGTPGKVFHWTRRDLFFDLEKLRIFVLDEADVMISTQGHHDQCLRIHRMVSKSCQMMLFSATYSPDVMNFAEMIINEPIIMQLKREQWTLQNVKQYYVVCHTNEGKYSALSNIYGAISIGQAIIFCHTRRTAAWLGNRLATDGHSVGYLSGELELNQRLEALTRFREGKEKVLITTNVCARGIDVEQVTVVINFDLPVKVTGEADCETYLHRIGRSGRFGKRGIAFNMVTSENDLRIVKEIQTYFAKDITKIDTDDVDDLENMG